MMIYDGMSREGTGGYGSTLGPLSSLGLQGLEHCGRAGFKEFNSHGRVN